ncbi:MAG: carotenoid oxygenase family protein [Acidobacteriota bacterium]
MTQDFAPGIENWLLFDEAEQSYPLEPSSGEVPDWIRGSYYVNGPARFQRGELQYRHWLDGDGMVRALHFDDEGIHFVSRWVKTRKLLEEEEQGHPVYRTFGTSFDNDLLRRGVMLEPPVNVSIYPLGERLLAFAEQSIPYELEPRTLQTLGEFDFGGRLNEVSPFAAHAKLDPAAGVMVNFGISFSASHPQLYLYEFDSTGRLTGRRRFAVDAPHTNHDFAITPRFALFFLSPLELDFGRFWGEGLSVMEALCWRPEKESCIFGVPRIGCELPPFRIPRDSGHCLHLINAYEEGDRLYLDLLEFANPIYPQYQPVPDFYTTVDPGHPVRYIIDIRDQKLLECQEMKYDRSPDFPSVASLDLGRPYTQFWMLGISNAGRPGRKFFDQLVRGDWKAGAVNDVYQAAPGTYLGGEPVHIAHPADDSTGSILIQEFDATADRVSFLIFDAGRLSQGPIARLPLRDKTHPGFHASFQRSH